MGDNFGNYSRLAAGALRDCTIRAASVYAIDGDFFSAVCVLAYARTLGPEAF